MSLNWDNVVFHTWNHCTRANYIYFHLFYVIRWREVLNSTAKRESGKAGNRARQGNRERIDSSR